MNVQSSAATPTGGIHRGSFLRVSAACTSGGTGRGGTTSSTTAGAGAAAVATAPPGSSEPPLSPPPVGAAGGADSPPSAARRSRERCSRCSGTSVIDATPRRSRGREPPETRCPERAPCNAAERAKRIYGKSGGACEAHLRECGGACEAHLREERSQGADRFRRAHPRVVDTPFVWGAGPPGAYNVRDFTS